MLRLEDALAEWRRRAERDAREVAAFWRSLGEDVRAAVRAAVDALAREFKGDPGAPARLEMPFDEAERRAEAMGREEKGQGRTYGYYPNFGRGYSQGGESRGRSR